MPYDMGEYYQHASDYDLEYQGQAHQDVPFWCELMMRYTPQRVLELACGSGRIGIELLHCPGSYQLEGLDISPEMLDAYRRKLAREPEAAQQRVTLHEGDMCDYQLEHKGQFDFIFLPFNSSCFSWQQGSVSMLSMAAMIGNPLAKARARSS